MRCSAFALAPDTPKLVPICGRDAAPLIDWRGRVVCYAALAFHCMIAPLPTTDVPARDQTAHSHGADASRIPAPPVPPVAAPNETALWPRPAQWAAGVLLFIVAVLVAWHWYRDHRGTRPGELVRKDSPAVLIDLNRADRAELQQLPGVGPRLADHILAYREAHGAFTHVEDLLDVNGIGDSTLSRLRPWLRVDIPDAEELEEPLRLERKKPSSSAASSQMLLINVNRAGLEE